MVTLTADLAMEQARIAEDEAKARRRPRLATRHSLRRQGLAGHGGHSHVLGNGTVQGSAIRFRCYSDRAAAWKPVQSWSPSWRWWKAAGGFGSPEPTPPHRARASAWNPDAWSGGSSSGSGSAVGAGLVPFAIGTETWGSILVPAAFNGITGFRPTYGTVSRRGAMSLSWTMDKIGPMCRTAEDCAMVLAAIAGSTRTTLPPTKDGSSRLEPIPMATHSPYCGRQGRCGLAGSPRQFRGVTGSSWGSIARLEEVSLPDYPWDAAAGLVIMAEAASAFEEFMLSAAWQAPPPRKTGPVWRTG